MTKSQLVLDAVERYLADLSKDDPEDIDGDIPVYDLAVKQPFRRAELYEERDARKFSR